MLVLRRRTTARNRQRPLDTWPNDAQTKLIAFVCSKVVGNRTISYQNFAISNYVTDRRSSAQRPATHMTPQHAPKRCVDRREAPRLRPIHPVVARHGQSPRALAFPWEDPRKVQTDRPNGCGDLRAVRRTVGLGAPCWVTVLILQPHQGCCLPLPEVRASCRSTLDLTCCSAFWFVCDYVPQRALFRSGLILMPFY